MLNILIVDDDAVHGRSVRDLLAAHNYPADTATSGQDGVRRLHRAHDDGNPYQVLVLDLHIPDLSGIEVLQAVGAAGLAVKTVVLSGENEFDSITPILKLGAIDYLRKPFEPQRLINSVANALSRYQLEVENATMQREAEENAKLYKFLLNASPDLVYMLDPEGHFRFINYQLDGVFDADFQHIVGQPWQALFTGHEPVIEQLSAHVNERRTGIRATVGEEFEYVSSIGSHHSLEVSAIGLYEGRTRSETGRFLGTYGIIRDVTESKRTRRQLQQSQRKFYSLFVDSPDAVFIAQLESGHIVERNPHFVSIRNDMDGPDDGTDAFLWTPDQPRTRFVEELTRQSDHHEWNIQKTVRGEQRYFEIRARRLDLEGEPCMIATLRDRTGERRAEQDRLALQRQRQQAGRMEAIGQVAGGIAHDFNNILASIIGYAELVMNARARLKDEQIDQYLDEVVTAGHRARDLISQMLSFTRAQRGDATYIDISKTITDVSRMLRAAIPSTIELHTDLPDSLPLVQIDPVQLQQIIINLLINARDAIEGNGRIRLDAEVSDRVIRCQTCGEDTAGEHVVIKVADDGHGIPADITERIFEMHFTTRDPDKGTGFGLWMTNNLVHEHAGHVQLESTPGQGTTFSILLPCARQLEARPPVEIPVPQIKGRIMVVDDEVSVANFIGEVLRDKGYPTVVFTESPQALAYLQKQADKVALLLTDGSMPLISGIELAEFAKSEALGIPVIFITAYSQKHDAQALKGLGVDRYLQKPFSIDEMLQAVGELTLARVAAASSPD